MREAPDQLIATVIFLHTDVNGRAKRWKHQPELVQQAFAA